MDEKPMDEKPKHQVSFECNGDFKAAWKKAKNKFREMAKEEGKSFAFRDFISRELLKTFRKEGLLDNNQ